MTPGVFWSFLLKQKNRGVTPLPLTTTEGGLILQPTKIVATKNTLQGQIEIPQVPIQWGTSPSCTTTWENAVEFYRDYPNFNLEGKVVPEGEGNVMSKRKVDPCPEVKQEIEPIKGCQLEELIIPNSIRAAEQVDGDPCIKGPRRSTRQVVKNKQLRDFV